MNLSLTFIFVLYEAGWQEFNSIKNLKDAQNLD